MKQRRLRDMCKKKVSLYIDEDRRKFFANNTFKEDYINNLIGKITEEQERIFLQRVKELGLHFDIEEEKKRRFKKFHTEYTLEGYSIYYNDGTDDGFRIITFITRQDEFIDVANIKYEISYY